MNDTAAFLAALGDVPVLGDAYTVRRKSRDMTAHFNPGMKAQALAHVADVVVQPRHQDDVLRIAAAAARTRMPLLMRGGGTSNLGQGIPLAGGAIVDTSALSKVLWQAPGQVRAEAGITLSALDKATQPLGWELRLHASTRRVATLGGFVGGGHAGVGSCDWGTLQERGNVLGLELVSVEERPRVVQLRGSEVALAHHAYGTTGIITAVDMPLAPAWPWRETVLAFPSFMGAVHMAHALASSDGVPKKLISVMSTGLARHMPPLQPFAQADSQALVLCMVAEPFMAELQALVAQHAGRVLSDAPEGKGAYGVPLYEMSWGHARMQVNKSLPEVVSNMGLYAGPRMLEAIANSHQRFSHTLGLHLEVCRVEGQVAFQGSPYFRYDGEAYLHAVTEGMAADGAITALQHAQGAPDVQQSAQASAAEAFQRQMDPHGLMNPGKRHFDARAVSDATGASLSRAAWYDRGSA